MKKTIEITAKYGHVRNVPMIKWEPFQPYWERVVRAMIEVIVENKFRPYTATMKRPDGIVASSAYWKIHRYSPKKFRFYKARKIVKDELNHFLHGKDRGSYIQALKAASNGARWADIKDAIKVRKRHAINDRKVQCIIDNLVDHMLITHNERDNIYTVTDPLVRYTVKGFR